MEHDVTREQALAIIAEHGGYGTVRVYGVISDEPYTGSILGIKSEYYLDKYNYSRLYSVSNDGTGMPPIGRA